MSGEFYYCCQEAYITYAIGVGISRSGENEVNCEPRADRLQVSRQDRRTAGFLGLGNVFAVLQINLRTSKAVC